MLIIVLLVYFIIINVLSAVMLSLIDFFEYGRDEDAPCKEANEEQADHVNGLLESPDVSKKFHDGVHAPIERHVLPVVTNYEADQHPLSRLDSVIIGPNVLYLGELNFVKLLQLEKLILKLRLSLHNIQVRSLLPLALHLEEEGIIYEVFDWVVKVREVEERVDKGDAEI